MISLKMAKAGVVYSVGDDHKISKAWKLNWIERIIMSRFNKRVTGK